jgi:O-antigen/teichoic acid export membrane protein
MASSSSGEPAPVRASGGEQQAPGEAQGESLSAKATRASAITLSSFIGAQMLRLGGNLVLTRLLFEEAFGLMALVYVFMTGLQLFSDVGIGPSLIQSKRGEEPAFQDTAFTLQAGRGVVLFVIACAAAAPYAMAYGAPELRTLLPATAVSALLAGLISTNLHTLNRKLSMTRLAIVELVSQAAALVAMIAYAWYSRSVWALVCGALTLNFVNMVLSHSILPGRRNRFGWDKSCARELFTFGRWIFLSTALSFLAAQSDRLIFGKLITLRELGIYNIAIMMASLPATGLARLSNSVIFPVFSQLFQRGENVDRAFRDVRKPLMLVGGFLVSALIAGGPVLIELLYDERFHEAGWMLQLLGVGSWFGFLEYTIMAGLLAAGRTKWIAAGAGARLIGIGVLIPGGFMLGGFPGALIGYAGSDVIRLIVSMLGAGRLGIRSWSQDFFMTFVVAVAAAVGHWASQQVMPHVPPGIVGELARAAAVGIAVSAVWLPLGLGYFAERRKRRAAAAAGVTTPA